jgi:hypothetical protein
MRCVCDAQPKERRLPARLRRTRMQKQARWLHRGGQARQARTGQQRRGCAPAPGPATDRSVLDPEHMVGLRPPTWCKPHSGTSSSLSSSKAHFTALRHAFDVRRSGCGVEVSEMQVLCARTTAAQGVPRARPRCGAHPRMRRGHGSGCSCAATRRRTVCGARIMAAVAHSTSSRRCRAYLSLRARCRRRAGCRALVSSRNRTSEAERMAPAPAPAPCSS